MKKFSAILFGGKILEYMHSHGYTYRSLGELLNATAGTIGSWANGKSIPTQVNARKMLDFGIRFGEFEGAIRLTPQGLEKFAADNDLSMKDLAALAGMNQCMVSEWKKGKRIPLMSTVYEWYTFMQEYGEKPKNQKPVAEEEQIVLAPIIKTEAPLVTEEEQPLTEEEKIKEIFSKNKPVEQPTSAPTTLNYIPNESKKVKVEKPCDDGSITIRKLVEWAEKHGVMDVPITLYAYRAGKQKLDDFGYNISCREEETLWIRGGENG